MTENEYNDLLNFFNEYTDRFINHAINPHPYILKKEHTMRVCENITVLATCFKDQEAKIRQAKAAALLHDIGRFRQYEAYGTFSDGASENHAALGIRVIHDHDLRICGTAMEKQRIIKAVALHNVRCLPEKLDRGTLRLARMLRDADKIDIFQVVTAHYREEDTDQNRYITHNLRNDSRISEGLVAEILQKQPLSYTCVHTINDLKLLQISWIFDLNFKESVQKVRDLNVIPVIVSTMPKSGTMAAVLEFVNNHMADTAA